MMADLQPPWYSFLGVRLSLLCLVICAGADVSEPASLDEKTAQAIASKWEAQPADAVDGPSQKRALLALFGLQNRDHGCAWPSQSRNAGDALRAQGFEVDVFRFEVVPVNNAGDIIIVDNAEWQAPAERLPCDFYSSANYTEIDAKTHARCFDTATEQELKDPRGGAALNGRCTYRTQGYPPGTVTNALRQLYSEKQVAKFLREHDGRYDIAIVLGSDVFLPKPIAAADIAAALEPGADEIFVTQNNDGGSQRTGAGYTNGFYLGTPAALIHVLSRFDDHDNFPEIDDYEKQLKRSFDRNGITRRLLQNYSTYMASFAKIRHSGDTSVGFVWGYRFFPDASSCRDGTRKGWVRRFDQATLRCMVERQACLWGGGARITNEQSNGTLECACPESCKGAALAAAEVTASQIKLFGGSVKCSKCGVGILPKNGTPHSWLPEWAPVL